MLQFQFCFAIFLLSTAQKLNFSFTDFVSKCDQIFVKLLICSHLLKKSLKENINFCTAKYMHFLSLYRTFSFYFNKISLASNQIQKWFWLLALKFPVDLISSNLLCSVQFNHSNWKEQRPLIIWYCQLSTDTRKLR